MQLIQIQHRASYGNHRYYPQCVLSQTIAKLMKAKSFTADDINLLRNVFTVDIAYLVDDPDLKNASEAIIERAKGNYHD